MRKLLLKLLPYVPEPMDMEKMRVWLWKSYKEDGFKNYYTMRKRYLVNMLVVEDDKYKRQEYKGRLNELKSLASNITSEANKRKK